MADEQEPLGDYLDRLIYSLYGAVQRGYGYVAKHPSHTEVVEYIEDENTGRPHPIEDAADHYLLRQFDLARREPFKIPPKSEFNGEIRGRYGTWRRADGTFPLKTEPFYLNAVHGEFGWRCFHGDPDWPCVECGHHMDEHNDPDEDPALDEWSCTAGAYRDETGWLCFPCNCGNNVGR